MPNPLLLGVTATVDRADRVGLDSVFEEITASIPMLELMQRGYLADLRAIQVKIAADFNTLRTRHGDIVDGEAGQLLMDADAPELVATAIKRHAAGRPTLVFTPTIAVAEAISDAVNAIGIPAAWLSGETPTETRHQILDDLRAGAMQVVANCAVLTEGFDCPSISCIVIARPTKSRSLYQQMVGRGSRTFPGKADCLILDVVGATTRHDLQSVPELFGLPPSALKGGKAVSEAIADGAIPTIETDVNGELVTTDVNGELVTTDVNGELVTTVVTLFRQRPARWIATKTGRFALPLGGSILVLRPGFGDAWDVFEILRNCGAHLLAGGMSLELATGFAEDLARAAGAEVLIDPNAWWRSQPPSDKQKFMLRRLGVPLKSIETKGDASDAISAALAAEAV
jgi:ATP-dependent helicase IRC3